MMVMNKDDLGLNLSLSCSNSTSNHDSSINRNLSPLELNLLSSSSSSSLPPPNLPLALAAPDSNPWNDSFGFSDRTSEVPCKVEGGAAAAAAAAGESRSILNGINVKRLPAIASEDEEAGVSSPNRTISSVSGKRSEREATGGDLETERTYSRGIRDEEDSDTSRKKLRLSKDQSAVLEESFKLNHTLNPKQKLALAKRLGLRPRQVEVWFQNRRARTKLKQTEFDCEFMRKCCEQLKEENRRLKKEVQELRSLKLSPQFYTNVTRSAYHSHHVPLL